MVIDRTFRVRSDLHSCCAGGNLPPPRICGTRITIDTRAISPPRPGTTTTSILALGCLRGPPPSPQPERGRLWHKFGGELAKPDPRLHAGSHWHWSCWLDDWLAACVSPRRCSFDCRSPHAFSNLAVIARKRNCQRETCDVHADHQRTEQMTYAVYHPLGVLRGAVVQTVTAYEAQAPSSKSHRPPTLGGRRCRLGSGVSRTFTSQEMGLVAPLTQNRTRILQVVARGGADVWSQG